MGELKAMLQEMAGWLRKPFSTDMPIGQILLLFVLFIVVAHIVTDGLRVLSAWTIQAAENVASVA